MTMKSHDHQKLFSPTQIGPITLSHRVVMAPLTRSRSLKPGDIPSDLMREYYTQRASDGGFIISEATSISITGRGWLGAPGLYSDEQVEGWKKITAAVHAKGCHMFSQLGHPGRSSHKQMTGGEAPVSASVNPAYWEDASHVVSTPSGWVRPSPHRALDLAEIPDIIEDYRKAAEYLITRELPLCVFQRIIHRNAGTARYRHLYCGAGITDNRSATDSSSSCKYFSASKRTAPDAGSGGACRSRTAASRQTNRHWSGERSLVSASPDDCRSATLATTTGLVSRA